MTQSAACFCCLVGLFFGPAWPATDPAPPPSPGGDGYDGVDMARVESYAAGASFGVFGGRPDVLQDQLLKIGEPPAEAWRVDVLRGAPARNIGLRIEFPRVESAGPRARRRLELRLLGAPAKRALRVSFTPHNHKNEPPSELVVTTLAAAQLNASGWRDFVAELPKSARSSAGTLRIALEGHGAGWVALQRVHRVDAPRANRPPAAPGADAPGSLRRCLWVWSTQQILSDPPARERFLSFVARRGFTDLFWQVVYDYQDAAITLGLVDEQRAFNESCARAAISVHALDGGAEYVRRVNHPRLFRLVDALAHFNAAAQQAERFAGIHMDNEPYLLEEWRSPKSRNKLIDEYVELNRELGRRTRAAGMAYGVDIPFWWDQQDERGKPVFTAATDDGRVPLLEALFPHVDNVGVMSYRERALGPNGIVACCETEFALGARRRVAVFASIETGAGPNVENGTTFAPYSATYLGTQLATLNRVLAFRPGAAGIAIHHYDAFRTKVEEKR